MRRAEPCLDCTAAQRDQDPYVGAIPALRKTGRYYDLRQNFQVPERNSLLRCFQFISPETIPYGRFCWNQDCQYCRVSCQLPDDDEPQEMLSCKFIVMQGMDITELSMELKWCLRSKLPADVPVS